MQTLDTLGAGLPWRPMTWIFAGLAIFWVMNNLAMCARLGSVYQEMLRQAVDAARTGSDESDEKQALWTPQINLSVEIVCPIAMFGSESDCRYIGVLPALPTRQTLTACWLNLLIGLARYPTFGEKFVCGDRVETDVPPDQC